MAYSNANNRTGPEVDAALERAIALSDSGVKTAYENNANTNAFSDAEKAKLTGVAPGAQVNPTDGATKIAYENNADTNAFSDAEQAKLAGIPPGGGAGDITVFSPASPLIPSAGDTGTATVFNIAGNAAVTVPDGLNVGFNVLLANRGAGGVIISFTGADTSQGELTLQDNNGMMSLLKVSATHWICSERA